MRISNFLLWQLAYAEIYVTDTLWPDFDSTRISSGALCLPAARSQVWQGHAVANPTRQDGEGLLAMAPRCR
jgi:hypothetical protein